VTDQECQNAWSVQVKTNQKPTSNWLVNKHALTLKSDSHVYVFVNLRGMERAEYVVAPSAYVASKVRIEPSKKGSVWYAFAHPTPRLARRSVLGGPGPAADAPERRWRALATP
jgi:hypothetical protein